MKTIEDLKEMAKAYTDEDFNILEFVTDMGVPPELVAAYAQASFIKGTLPQIGLAGSYLAGFVDALILFTEEIVAGQMTLELRNLIDED